MQHNLSFIVTFLALLAGERGRAGCGDKAIILAGLTHPRTRLPLTRPALTRPPLLLASAVCCCARLAPGRMLHAVPCPATIDIQPYVAYVAPCCGSEGPPGWVRGHADVYNQADFDVKNPSWDLINRATVTISNSVGEPPLIVACEIRRGELPAWVAVGDKLQCTFSARLPASGPASSPSVWDTASVAVTVNNAVCTSVSTSVLDRPGVPGEVAPASPAADPVAATPQPGPVVEVAAPAGPVQCPASISIQMVADYVLPTEQYPGGFVVGTAIINNAAATWPVVSAGPAVTINGKDGQTVATATCNFIPGSSTMVSRTCNFRVELPAGAPVPGWATVVAVVDGAACAPVTTEIVDITAGWDNFK